MVRTLPPVPSSLRNRNRINNKSRLKIVVGNFDADSIIPDEDEERHRLQQSVLGVDQDDANEHHLQAVLSEAAQRSSEKKEVPAAYIPTPDSTGIVSNYDDIYPSNKWKDPTTYIYSSVTAEECCDSALANAFTYFMDERDKDWLDKNNELARGEGTSAQGALLAAAGGTRASARSAKAKGKEPEAVQVAITEDEFELVMGVFEKVTHEKTEFLHHSLETGMTFPAFTDYQDVFSSPLTPQTFAAFEVPSWIPAPAQLLRIARAIYPHWRTRRLDRNGHCVIPTLNFDETDTLNESYVCFRRRELKAVRKTRATQVTTSDKLSKLQAELAVPLQLAELILNRENQKKELTTETQVIWEKRLQLVDLKRKHLALGERGDEELLFDKERPVKKVEPFRQKTLAKQEPVPPRPPEPAILRPRERLALIRANTDTLLSRLKEKDHNWEDYLDCAYQSTPGSFASRLFKFIPPSESKSREDTSSPRPVRLRYGRGGRLLVDRRRTPSIPTTLRRQRRYDSEPLDDNEDAERTRTLTERWKYDADDNPSAGPWADEQDRTLVDDYDHKYIRWTMGLLVENDHHFLNTNPTIFVTGNDGQPHPVVPYRLGVPPPAIRGPQAIRAPQGALGTAAALPLMNGAPVSISQQMRMQSNQVRLPSNGAVPPPPVVVSMQAPTASQSPTQSVRSSTPTSDANGVNGAETHKTDVLLANGVPTITSDANGIVNGHASAITRPKSTQEQPVLANGYHVSPNGYANPAMNGYVHHLNPTSALSAQQMQNLKSAFAAPGGQDTNRNITPFSNANTNFAMPLAGSGNINLKLPPTRQMQWNGALQRATNGVVNGIDGNASLSVSMSPPDSAIPRTPTRTGLRAISNGHQHSLSPHSQHSPSPIPSIAQSQSPTRPTLTPTIAVAASPSMQH